MGTFYTLKKAAWKFSFLFIDDSNAVKIILSYKEKCEIFKYVFAMSARLW